LTENETKSNKSAFQTFKVSGHLIAIFNFSWVSVYKVDDYFEGKEPIFKNIECKGVNLFFEIQSTGWNCLMVLKNENELGIYYMSNNGDLVKFQTMTLKYLFSKELIGCSNDKGSFILIAHTSGVFKLMFDGEKFEQKDFQFDFYITAKLMSINSDSTILSMTSESTSVMIDIDSFDYLTCIKFPLEVGFHGLFSKFDPTIFLVCDDFSLKIFLISKENKDPPQLIQVLSLKHDSFPNYSVSGLCESSDGKSLYLGSSKGIWQFKILNQYKLEGIQKMETLKNVKFLFKKSSKK
jgi:hypothetical protein